MTWILFTRRFSKQAFLQDVPNPHDLPDDTPSFQDFMGNRNNRFTNPEAAAKNHILLYMSKFLKQGEDRGNFVTLRSLSDHKLYV